MTPWYLLSGVLLLSTVASAYNNHQYPYGGNSDPRCNLPNTCEQVCLVDTGIPRGFRCQCIQGFVPNQADPDQCDPDCNVLADVVLLLDGSGSISAGDFDITRQFFISLSQMVTVGPNNIQFASVTFDSTPTLNFDLDDNPDATSLVAAINAINQPGGGTRTDLALDLVRNQMLFDAGNGGRANAPNFVIVITDGESNQMPLTVTAAMELRNTGVTIIAVGVGGANEQELRDIASDDRLVFLVPDFNALMTIVDQVIAPVCDVDECLENQFPVCEQMCQNILGSFECSCRSGFTVNANDPTKCDDIDECAVNNPCQQLCFNKPGTFKCGCRSGYYVSPFDPTACRRGSRSGGGGAKGGRRGSRGRGNLRRGNGRRGNSGKGNGGSRRGGTITYYYRKNSGQNPTRSPHRASGKQ